MLRPHSKQLLFIVGLIVIGAIFTGWAFRFMQAEHTIYGWDAIGFWKIAAELAYRPDHSYIGSIAAFGRSMHHDYNDICALPAAFVMVFWNTSRLAYVMASVVFLNLPVAILCLWLLVRMELATWQQTAASILAFFALMAVPLPWIVTLSGMTDVGGLIMAAIATDLLIRTEIRSKDTVRWLAIGAALAASALCKRWYLYLVIGLLTVLLMEIVLDWIVTIRRTRSLGLKPIYDAAYGPFLCLGSLVGVYFLSFPLPLTIMKTDYSTIYSAYRMGDSWTSSLAINFYLIVTHFGVAQIVLASLCFIAALFFVAMRRAVLYLFVPAWLALADFSRVQTANGHHLLLLYIALATPPLFLARELLSPDFRPGKPWGWALLALTAIISCLSFQSVFAQTPPFGTSVVQSLFPTERVQPIQRHDLGEIEALMRFIGNRVTPPSGNPPVKNVYLLSSSLLFNSSHLSFASFELGKPLPASDYICQTSDVDLRDGFPEALLTAQMVLVADPIQTHLAKAQKVLNVPADIFLQGEGFAHAFNRDEQVFQLDEGVKVYVFERTRPSTPEEIADLRQRVGVPSIKPAPETNGFHL